MIHVLHLIVSLDRGGAERSLLELIREPADDIEHAVCAIKPGGALLPEFQAALPNRLHSLGITKQADMRIVPRLARLLSASRPTLVHTWMFHANVLGRVVGAAMRLPVVCGLRSAEFEKSPWRVAVDRATNHLATHTVAVSRATLEIGVRRDGVHRERASVIPNGITLPSRPAALEGISRGQPVIGAIGRLEPVKDHATLVHAFARVHAECPDARLEIVGRGPERGRLKRLARELGIEEQVTLRGEVPDARNLTSEWDIYVQPSVSEGMPRAVLEAMAAGLPITATDVGGVREALDCTGIIVPARAPHLLAQAILTLINDVELCRELGTSARRRVETQFSQQTFARSHFGLYRTIVSGRERELAQTH